MRAFEKNFEGLVKVCNDIVYSSLSYVHHVDELSNSVKVCFPCCASINSSILALIPCNYLYDIKFEFGNIYLVISYE